MAAKTIKVDRPPHLQAASPEDAAELWTIDGDDADGPTTDENWDGPLRVGTGAVFPTCTRLTDGFGDGEEEMTAGLEAHIDSQGPDDDAGGRRGGGGAGKGEFWTRTESFWPKRQ